MKRIALTLALMTAVAAHADEGMWLFNAPPTQQIQQKYHFTLTPQWLDHVRLGSVRFNNGGSGSFVSADGLTFTNHHVGADCLQKLGTSGHDYIKEGFYAKTQPEEAKCPDLELNQLVGIEDVTAQVNAAAKPGMAGAELATAQRSAMANIERDCNAKGGLRCDVVALYSGAMYHLYRYKKYTDVRVVFAPEFSMAFFGGDPDNFEFPRWDLDITFFRVYENDKPAHIDDYLRWSPTGTKEGDLVFVSGHPGGTSRLLTISQIEFLRDQAYPLRLQDLRRRDELLKAFSTKSEENARIAQEDIFGIENSFKALTGYLGGIKDPQVMAKKQSEEDRLKQAANGPQEKSVPGVESAWGELDKAVQVNREILKPLFFLEQRGGFRGDLATDARILVRAAAERAKPNGERLPQYRDSALPSLEQALFSTAPIHKDLEEVELADSLAFMQQELGANDPNVKAALNGRDPQQVAHDAVANTKLDDVAVRKQLYEGGAQAVQASNDPMIKLLQSIEPTARQLRTRSDNEVDAVNRGDGALISKLRFALMGTNTYPDATFTLRLSYGTVKGYSESEQTLKTGTIQPGGNQVQIAPYTFIGGAYDHAAEHGDKAPYQLPASWMNAKSKLNLKTPMNFVSTADIIGGNSGSPVVDKKGEVVGIIFDGNIQSLAGNFVYDESQNRALRVDSRALLEGLRKVYNADALASELTGGKR